MVAAAARFLRRRRGRHQSRPRAQPGLHVLLCAAGHFTCPKLWLLGPFASRVLLLLLTHLRNLCDEVLQIPALQAPSSCHRSTYPLCTGLPDYLLKLALNKLTGTFPLFHRNKPYAHEFVPSWQSLLPITKRSTALNPSPSLALMNGPVLGRIHCVSPILACLKPH